MTTWVYRTLRYHSSKWWDTDDNEVDILALGRAGWELVSVVEHGMIVLESSPDVGTKFYAVGGRATQLYLGFFKRGSA